MYPDLLIEILPGFSGLLDLTFSKSIDSRWMDVVNAVDRLPGVEHINLRRYSGVVEYAIHVTDVETMSEVLRETLQDLFPNAVITVAPDGIIDEGYLDSVIDEA